MLGVADIGKAEDTAAELDDSAAGLDDGFRARETSGGKSCDDSKADRSARHRVAAEAIQWNLSPPRGQRNDLPKTAGDCRFNRLGCAPSRGEPSEQARSAKVQPNGHGSRAPSGAQRRSGSSAG